jgi:hypothetical protein
VAVVHDGKHPRSCAQWELQKRFVCALFRAGRNECSKTRVHRIQSANYDVSDLRFFLERKFRRQTGGCDFTRGEVSLNDSYFVQDMIVNSSLIYDNGGARAYRLG